MKLSTRGIEMLSKLEGVELQAYRDVVGLLTIGVGHLITNTEKRTGRIQIGSQSVEYTRGLTLAQAHILLAQDVAEFEDALNDHLQIHHVSLLQHQFDALIMWMFNIGIGAATRSTLFKRIAANFLSGVPAEFAKWNKAGGKVIQGLVNRRQHEAHLFRTGHYI